MFKEFDLKRFLPERGKIIMFITVISYTASLICFVQGLYYFSESKAASDIYVLLRGIFCLIQGLFIAFLYRIYLVYTDWE